VSYYLYDLLFFSSQKVDNNKDARLADYFDVIGGTSTGGLLTAMITTPNETNRPFAAAKDIVPFYFEHGPQIFNSRYIYIFIFLCFNLFV